MIYTTSICSNYISKAEVLAMSIKKYDPTAIFVLCITERDVHKQALNSVNFNEIVLSKNLGFINFEKFIFKHTIVEASTSVKAQLFLYLLKKYKNEKYFTYLDPDIMVTSELKELKVALKEHSIILTPHLTIPEKKTTYEKTLESVVINELCALQHGAYNLGFVSITRSPEAVNFIRWWKSRLDMFCYDDIPRGIFTDQKWMDLAPSFFDVYILKHPGYNAAPWNISMRYITFKNKHYYSNEKPLRFFHFSGYDSGANESMLNKFIINRSNAVYRLKKEYIHLLNKYKQTDLAKEKWSYDYYISGEKIDRNIKIAIRGNLMLLNKIYDPFLESNSKFKAILNLS
jgi:hypothetical protein